MAAANPDRTALCRADGGLAVETEAHGNRRDKSLGTKVRRKNQIPLLDRLWQAEARLERSFTRAQRELERLQKSRREQLTEAVPANIKHPKSDIPPPESPDLIYTAAPLAATSQPASLTTFEP